VVVTAVGSAVGLVLAVGVARLFDSLVFGVAPRDPAAFVAVSVMMIGVAILASFLAARRGIRVDPVVALRTD
jgi:ABC-type antimicrobial peptide transport system permease subunit